MLIFSSRLIPARFVLSGLRVLILWQILFPAFCSAETGPVRVVVTASHDQALFHWIKAAQAGIIPPEGNRVIHYDSHPDMGVPDCNPGNTWLKQGDPDISCVDIASFQLGAVWKGLVSNIVWVRPPTAEQFDNGTYSFHIGESAGGRLKVDLPRDYYLADRAWAPKETLKRPVAVTMRVVPYHQLASVLKKNDQKVILDIDMDSFFHPEPGAWIFC